MGIYQKALLIVFLSATIFLLVMEVYVTDGDVLSYSRYIIMLCLGVATFSGRGDLEEQRRLSWAFPLMLTGDFFLVFSYTIEGFTENIRCFGFIPFSMSYIIMIKVYLKGFRWSNNYLLPSIFYGVAASALIITLYPYVDGIIAIAGFVALGAVTVMSWAGSVALWNGYYSKRSAIMMALSGFLMAVCDYGVAMEMFYPGFYTIREAIAINVVWLSYLPGWSILALLVVDKNETGGVYGRKKQVYNT